MVDGDRRGRGRPGGRTSSIAHGKSLAFSRDGRWLATGGYDGDVGVWEVATEEEVPMRRMHTSQVNAVAFSPDGSVVAGAGVDRRIVLWGRESGQPLAVLAGHKNTIYKLLFIDGGRRLLSRAGTRPSGCGTPPPGSRSGSSRATWERCGRWR